MRPEDFDFDLPDDRIALRPARPRDAARLLVIEPDGGLHDRVVRDLPDWLAPGDALVVNDTKVVRAALTARRAARASGGGGPVQVTINLHRRDAADVWRAFARPAKRLAPGDVLSFAEGALLATVLDKSDGADVGLRFDQSGTALDEALERLGAPPLPPYIAKHRAADDQDVEDYQTVFARTPGSVAAPTAGLHFTPELLDRLARRGVTRESVTLHVGAGTFLPVKSETLNEHVMHAEWCALEAQTAARLRQARDAGGRIVAVGTTSLRTLESAARDGSVEGFAGETDLFIAPGYQFRAVDALMTNFHLPRSTLFMLVCALAGVDVAKRAYAHAIARGYRFYSYGDACLFLTR